MSHHISWKYLKCFGLCTLHEVLYFRTFSLYPCTVYCRFVIVIINFFKNGNGTKNLKQRDPIRRSRYCTKLESWKSCKNVQELFQEETIKNTGEKYREKNLCNEYLRRKNEILSQFVWSEEFSNSFFTKYVIHKIPFLYCTSTHLCSIIHLFYFNVYST